MQLKYNGDTGENFVTTLNKSAKALVSEALLSARAYAQVVR